MVEAALKASPQFAGDCIGTLHEKVADERFPSVPMLQRIQRVAETLPIYRP